MNNYLASIVARTLNTGQPVRPRLRGRFDPAGDGLTSAAPLDRSAPWDAEPERPTTQPRAVRRAPGAEPAAALPSMDAAIAPHAPPPARAAGEPGMFREPQRARQPEPDDLQSIRQRLDAIESLNAISTPPEDGRELSTAAPPDGRPAPQAAEPPRPQVFAHAVTPAPRQLTERSANDTGPTPRPAAAMKSVVERETRTVILRDERSLDDVPPRRDRAAPPQAAGDHAPQPEASRGRESEAAPPTPQSRIVPAEFAYENLPLRPTRLQPPPTIRVTIGRIEVRAVQPPQSPAKPRATQPVMSLDDYLRRRGQGSVR